MTEGVFLTQQQREALNAQRLDWERHNVWRLLTKDGTQKGSCGPCLCSKCQAELAQPDIRDGGNL